MHKQPHHAAKPRQPEGHDRLSLLRNPLHSSGLEERILNALAESSESMTTEQFEDIMAAIANGG